MNFWNCVRTVRVEFQDYFQTVRVEILGFLSEQSGHKFQKCFWVFLDSMESPLSLEFNQIAVNSIWWPNNL